MTARPRAEASILELAEPTTGRFTLERLEAHTLFRMLTQQVNTISFIAGLVMALWLL
jgi:hypothetical protein